MPKFVLPDEDVWVLPEAWRAGLHPRRGGLTVPGQTVAADELPALPAEPAADPTMVIFDPDLLASGMAHLDSWRAAGGPGEAPDPRAAAAAALLSGRRLVHAWVSRFGLEFAVRATGEMSRLVTDGALWAVDPATEESYEQLWRSNDLHNLTTVARALRSLLAAAPDDDYAQACDILAGYRTSAVGRILTSYLVPTQVAWVDADCAATAAGWPDEPDRGEAFSRGDHRHLSGILIAAASTVEHLEQLRGTVHTRFLGSQDRGLVGTVLDGVGIAAAVPIFGEEFYRDAFGLHCDDIVMRNRLDTDSIRLLAAVPSDDALRLMFRETFAVRPRPGLVLRTKVLTRFPVRALRVLAELEAEGGGPLPTAMLGYHVLTEPRLLPAVAESLPPAVRDRAAQIAAGDTGVEAAWVRLLDDHEDGFRPSLDGADEQKRAVGALAAIPTEEALAQIAARVDRRNFRPALLTAAKRNPRLALRVLAASGTDELLRNHVLAYPDAVADTLPHLGPDARSRVEAITGPAHPATDTTLPAPAGQAPTAETTHTTPPAQAGPTRPAPTAETTSGMPPTPPGQARPAQPAETPPPMPARPARPAPMAKATGGLPAAPAGPPPAPLAESTDTTSPVPAGPARPAPPAGAVPPVLVGPLRRADGKAVRVPGLPVWLVPAALPAVTLRDGSESLSPEAVRNLCGLIAVSKITEAHPGIAEVRAACEQRDLAAFAWAILEQWRAAHYPAPSKLAMVALAVLGDDSTVPPLVALFEEWRLDAVMRVRTGMDVLAAIGTGSALAQLDRLARKARSTGVRRFAEQRLNDAAAARGLGPAELADRVVPSLGLDPDGRAELDYGPRRFTVGFDEQFQATITDQQGARLARLPRPAATDDATLAAAAQRRFTELKKDVKVIAAERARALEEAMTANRRWTGADFRDFFVDHPLHWQLTRRLLWAAFDEQGQAVATFRAAEDRTFADLDDKTWILDEAATVGVAHPCHFGADRAAWAEIFADYAIIQPFPQLSRELYTLADLDLDAAGDRNFETGRLYALTARGWRFADGHSSLLRDWPGGITIEIDYGPGFHWQEPELPRHLDGVRGDLAALDPVSISEVIRDVRFLLS